MHYLLELEAFLNCFLLFQIKIIEKNIKNTRVVNEKKKYFLKLKIKFRKKAFFFEIARKFFDIRKILRKKKTFRK